MATKRRTNKAYKELNKQINAYHKLACGLFTEVESLNHQRNMILEKFARKKTAENLQKFVEVDAEYKKAKSSMNKYLKLESGLRQQLAVEKMPTELKARTPKRTKAKVRKRG